ncbi:alpha-L-rhamnosidase-related protein [Paenibacillus swuensis]|uniref:alpha-L-rhamnosidase-related protein n=1 Tax=Paenibacillus swuensis TaxID=1178515 RepID=UPI0008396F67|nr:alpha-L-rhamnosidase C-terminal domain-containing protein [Paenibacillus swuensis]
MALNIHTPEETHRFRGKWIWDEGMPRQSITGGHELVYFRKSFQVPSEEEYSLVLRVSADSRYRLYVNGFSVAIGPCKGDRNTHYYETVDVSEYIKHGNNVIAAKVLHYATSEPFRPGAGMTSVWRADTGVFLLDGELRLADTGVVVASLHTDEQWLCSKDEALTFEQESWMTSIFLGGVERVDGRQLPHGWELEGYDASSWKPAVIISDTILGAGILPPWQLAPRPIPFLFERPSAFRAISRRVASGSVEADHESMFFTSKADQLSGQDAIAPLVLKPHSTYIVELDAGELTTGYLRAELAGGQASRVRMLSSECYESEPVEHGKRNKGLRDSLQDTFLAGDGDEYIAAGCGSAAQGAASEIYEPFWFRTFRYIRLEIQTDEQPMTLLRFSYRETGYPLEVKALFNSSDERLAPLWRISLNTLQRCMHETYEDCPFYEQLQYTFDTRLQILFTYQLSADDRLARRAIYDYHSSLLPSGILQSRYPSVEPQVIPGFALDWTSIVWDHYQYFGDLELVRRYRPTMEAVLGWFERRLDDAGLVGPNDPAYWNWVDWVEAWPDGIPPATHAGANTAYSMKYAVALDYVAELCEATGRGDAAAEYRQRSRDVRAALLSRAWSPEKRMFRDSPDVEAYSQHMQVYGVLAGLVSGEDARELLRRALSDKELPQMSYSNGFYVFRALALAGIYEEAYAAWEPWHRMVGLNMTSWAEDPFMQRSDCHAWGAVPLYDFTAEVLGVKPGLPGYAEILVSPKPGPLTWAKGTVATPHGEVYVSWRVDQDTFFIEATAPPRIPVKLMMPDGTAVYCIGGDKCTATCPSSVPQVLQS